MIKKALEAAEDPVITIGLGKNTIDPIGTGDMETFFGDGFTDVGQEIFGFSAQKLFKMLCRHISSFSLRVLFDASNRFNV